MTYSYYSPGSGTVALSTYKPMLQDIALTGEARDMVVACDQSRRVYGIIGGLAAWYLEYANSWPRAICIFEGLLFIGDGTDIHIANPRTGYVHRTISVPSAPDAINGLSITRYQNQTWVIVCFSGTGTGTVRGYLLDDLSLTLQWSNPLAASHPRHAELIGGWVFVCDTFGHEVYAVDLASGGLRNSIEVYFPNHIHMVASERGLITAEHENRVIDWTYYPTEVITLACAAPVAPFNDATKDKTDIVAAESGTLDPNSSFSPKKSLCAEEAQGDDTLYSPNSARLYGTDLLVADTDNHAVKIFRSGSVVTKVSGFNNPVTALLI